MKECNDFKNQICVACFPGHANLGLSARADKAAKLSCFIGSIPKISTMASDVQALMMPDVQKQWIHTWDNILIETNTLRLLKAVTQTSLIP